MDKQNDGIRFPAFAKVLRELHEKAGSPPYPVLVKQAAKQGITLSNSSLSDWFKGISVPRDAANVRFLVEYLQPVAARKASYRPRPSHWWEEQRRAAQQKRRGEAQRGKADSAAGAAPPYTSPRMEGGSPPQSPQLGKPIAELDPVDELEVHPAISPADLSQASLDALPTYVRRDHDTQLDTIVDEVAQLGGPVPKSRLSLLVGDSSTGKTRALWEAVQRLPGPWRVWRPASRQALLRGLASGRLAPHTVLWLNETQRFFNFDQPDRAAEVAAELTELLHDPERGPVLILGTLWRDVKNRLTTGSDEHRAEARSQIQALLEGRTIALPEAFDETALANLRNAATQDARLAEAVNSGGTRITQYLAGARHLMGRYEEAFVEAQAVVDTAADARRLGHRGDLSLTFLQAAAGACIPDDHRRSQPDQWHTTWFDEALAYVREPCRGVPGPLTPNPPDAHGVVTYRLADYLEQHLTRTRTLAVPPAGWWEAAADHVADEEDLLRLGNAAERRGLFRHAVALYRLGHERHHNRASDGLTHLLVRIQDIETAETTAHEAAEHDGGECLDHLVRYYDEHGQEDRALELAVRAAATGSLQPFYTLMIFSSTAGSRSLARKEEITQLAADAGVGMAAETLMERYEAQGDTCRADYYGRRACSTERFKPLRRLGADRWQRDDHEGARRAWNMAVEFGDLVSLQTLAAADWVDGNPAGAEDLVRRAAAAGDPTAWELLAEIRYEENDYEAAQDLFRRSIEEGNRSAFSELAKMWYEIGDDERARRVTEEALQAGYTRVLATLAYYHEDCGRFEDAGAFALRAAEAGECGPLVHMSGRALQNNRMEDAFNWGVSAMTVGGSRQGLAEMAAWLHQEDRPDEAMTFYRAAIDHGRTDLLIELADIHVQAGDTSAARAALERAAREGVPGAVVPLARIHHACGHTDYLDRARAASTHEGGDPSPHLLYSWTNLCLELSDTDRARSLMQQAAAKQSTDLLKAGELAQRAGDTAQAHRLLRQALNAGLIGAFNAFLKAEEQTNGKGTAQHLEKYGVRPDDITEEKWW